ncbi:MAG TPA: GyrI-like domain-containing protein [Anaerolineaceae bacterium]|jgi:effector-binding domain-containing protein|nr:GyrI-like domain-containing protein [Anaerolineaceae bacterium]
MKYDCRIIEAKDQPVLVVRTITAVENLPAFFGEAYGSIMQYLEELGEQPVGMPFAAYYNLDMKALDVEAGFPVARSLPAKDKIHSGMIAGGKFGITLHVGSYDTVEPAYEALTAYVKQQGFEPTGVAYEYYLNDPGEDPSIKPETEIRFPLK